MTEETPREYVDAKSHAAWAPEELLIIRRQKELLEAAIAKFHKNNKSTVSFTVESMDIPAYFQGGFLGVIFKVSSTGEWPDTNNLPKHGGNALLEMVSVVPQHNIHGRDSERSLFVKATNGREENLGNDDNHPIVVDSGVSVKGNNAEMYIIPVLTKP